jgi:hypothetical protein
MTIVDLLERLHPEEYWFDGARYLTAKPNEAAPLTVSCTFFREGHSLLLSGTYRHQTGSTSHPFEARLSLRTSAAPVCTLNSSHTGEVSGRLFAVGTGFAVLMTASEGKAVACQLEVTHSGTVHVTGNVTCEENEFAFVANGEPGPERQVRGNVVRVLGGRKG